MKKIVIIILSIILAGTVIAQKKVEIKSFIAQIPFIKFNNNFEEYEKFINENLKYFSDQKYKLLDVQVKLYTAWGKYKKVMELLEKGHKNGYFFSLEMRLQREKEYKPLLKFKGFDRIFSKDKKLRKKAIIDNKMKYQVKTPNNYQKEKSYPLLFIFHGGGGNLKLAESRWISKELFNNFIIIFVQSYRYQKSMDVFGWPSPGDKRINEELKNIFKEVKIKYRIDYNKIILAGMSTGGRVAIDMALKQILPATYFIGICPKKPTDFNASIVKNAKQYIKKGYILTGEQDWALKNQKIMVKVFTELKFKHIFKILPNMGHQFPMDFKTQIKSILKYIGK